MTRTNIAVTSVAWERLAQMETREFAKTLKKIAAHVDLERYRKSKRGPKKPPPGGSRRMMLSVWVRRSDG